MNLSLLSLVQTSGKFFVDRFKVSRENLWAWAVMATVLALAVYELRRQGRVWWCACGQAFLWAGEVWSSHNSQHLFDPYSFTHVLHGFVFCALLAWSFPRISTIWRLCFAVSLEALWEVIENSSFIIERYRETTAALGYHGDSIANLLGDILSCSIGFMIAGQLGWRRSLIVFAAVEIILLLWIRDSLLLDALVLLYPIESIKAWQLGH